MREPRKPQRIASDSSRAVPRQRERANCDPEYAVSFGARIRAARIAASMSQSALGEAIGVSFQQVQKYEKGLDRVAVSTLQGIAGALGVHPGAFFDVSVPAPVGPIPDMKAAIKAADVLGQIRDPRVLKQILALATALGECEL